VAASVPPRAKGSVCASAVVSTRSSPVLGWKTSTVARQWSSAAAPTAEPEAPRTSCWLCAWALSTRACTTTADSGRTPAVRNSGTAAFAVQSRRFGCSTFTSAPAKTSASPETASRVMATRRLSSAATSSAVAPRTGSSTTADTRSESATAAWVETGAPAHPAAAEARARAAQALALTPRRPRGGA